jgi:hypothetical protein
MKAFAIEGVVQNEMIGDIIMLLQSPIQRVIGGLEKKAGESEAAA